MLFRHYSDEMDRSTFIFNFIVTFNALLPFGYTDRNALFIKNDFRGDEALPVALTEARGKHAYIDCIRQCFDEPECRSVNVCYNDAAIRCEPSNDIVDGSCSTQCLCLEDTNPCENGGTFYNRQCSCVDGFAGRYCQRLMRDCTEGKILGYLSSGRFMIQPFGYDSPILVLCELPTGRTFFFYKKTPAADFFQGWADYRNGFGPPGLGDFWLGNEYVYQILKQGTYTMTVFTSTVTTGHYHGSQYANFRLGSEPEGYVMSFDSFLNEGFSVFDVFCSDDASISLNGTTFSTYDHGDQSSMANASRSGWWFDPSCFWDFNGSLGETQLLYEGQMETLYEVYSWIENTEYYVE